jgi:CRP-like cAMP-binding protein
VAQTTQDEQLELDGLLTDEWSGGKENSPMLTLIEKVIFLKHVSFFQRMTTEQLRVLAGISEEVSFAADEHIISEGGQSMTLYVIVSGRAAVQRVTNKRRRSIARLAVLGPKEYFAEMSLFDDEPHSADVVALEDTQLLLVRRDPLIMLIKRQPELGLELLRVLSQRLRQSNAQLSEKTQARPQELLDVYDKLWGE